LASFPTKILISFKTSDFRNSKDLKTFITSKYRWILFLFVAKTWKEGEIWCHINLASFNPQILITVCGSNMKQNKVRCQMKSASFTPYFVCLRSKQGNKKTSLHKNLACVANHLALQISKSWQVRLLLNGNNKDKADGTSNKSSSCLPKFNIQTTQNLEKFCLPHRQTRHRMLPSSHLNLKADQTTCQAAHENIKPMCLQSIFFLNQLIRINTRLTYKN
jgi:hypothetical protein